MWSVNLKWQKKLDELIDGLQIFKYIDRDRHAWMIDRWKDRCWMGVWVDEQIDTVWTQAWEGKEN